MRFSLFVLFIAAVSATTYFHEKFDDGDKWEERWVHSTSKPAEERGKFILSAGKFYADRKRNVGLKTGEDARFYLLSTKTEKFSNADKTLIIQYRIKHEQNIDCGGGYLKFFNELDQENWNGESDYNIMFGPDICGYSTKKVHVIFSYKGKNHLIEKDIPCKSDELSHLYTLILMPDGSYEVRIDNEKVESGNVSDDWKMLPPKTINDPKESKPSDWVDEETISDPDDSKPEDWDQPETITDPDAKQPEDWDDEMDGEWEPPMIDNPDYKGEWAPKQIKNPDYKGPWEHPQIDNPEYNLDDVKKLAKYDFNHVGIDLWQVKAGTIFDDVIITDDEDVIEKAAEEFLKDQKEEKAKKDEFDEEERKKAEATKDVPEEEDNDIDDVNDDDDEHDEL